MELEEIRENSKDKVENNENEKPDENHHPFAKELSQMKSILNQDFITDEDAEKFKEIFQDVSVQEFCKDKGSGSLSHWAYQATQKFRFDISTLIFDHYKTYPTTSKLSFLIRFYPNDDATINQIKSLVEDADLSDLKKYKNYGNSYLDLCCGISKPKPEVVEILLNKGMNVQDMRHLFIDNVECLRLVLFDKTEVRPHVKSIINQKDPFDGCTALHKAAQRRCQKSVKYLLQAGANFGTTNHLGESCISQIDPVTLENFLDEHCIKTNEKPLNEKDFKLTFDYR